MPHDFSKEFFAAYHAAVFDSLGPDAAKYNARIGSLLASTWIKRLGKLPSGSDGFKKALEAWFSGPFCFSDTAGLSIKDGKAVLHVAGCDICRGNEILRNSGKKGCCPISQMVKSALGRGLKKQVELTGSEKPGPVGECFLKYNISNRHQRQLLNPLPAPTLPSPIKGEG